MQSRFVNKALLFRAQLCSLRAGRSGAPDSSWASSSPGTRTRASTPALDTAVPAWAGARTGQTPGYSGEDLGRLRHDPDVFHVCELTTVDDLRGKGEDVTPDCYDCHS